MDWHLTRVMEILYTNVEYQLISNRVKRRSNWPGEPGALDG